MAMCLRRSVASTSGLVVWWVGAGSLEAWGSSSAREDTSQTVTGRPPRATLAWRRVSHLPSTSVSGSVTRGSHAHRDTTGRPDEPTITMGIRWHKGARTTYATNCINRQAKRGRGFAPHVRRAYCSGNGRWSPTKGTPRDAPESLLHSARWARPARSHRRPAGSRAHPHRRGPGSRRPRAAPGRPHRGGHRPGNGRQRTLRARPRDGEHAARHLPGADPPAPGGRGGFLARGDLQDRKEIGRAHV